MITAALIGNPNSGKTTVFNKLTGSIQHVGNWPGVTVERKQGYIRGATDDRILVVDLPGIYSLSPYSPDEVVSRDYLIGNSKEKPDVAINLIDASNLERGLYLCTQIADMGIPMVIVLNMMDVAGKTGMVLDAGALSEAIGCEVVETVGIRGRGTKDIADAVQRAYESKKVPNRIDYGPGLEACAEKVDTIIHEHVREGLSRWAALKLIERDEMVLSDLDRDVVDRALEAVAEFEKESDDDGVQIVATARYAAGIEIQKKCVRKTEIEHKVTVSEKVDRVLLNKFAAIPIFAAVMYLVYYVCIQTVGTMGSDYINDEAVPWIQSSVGDALLGAGVEQWLSDLVVSGIIGGVGAVIGFLPLIIVLFFLLALLEEVGYMARVAYILDRIFVRFGLSGKSVIPAVIGIGCGVPAVMGTRTIEDESNRTVSVMTTTFMPCSAKLPILTVIVAAFFGGSAIVALSMYFLGIAMVLFSGLFLKKFSGFVGKPSPFIMELPLYHAPTARNVAIGVGEKSWAFVKKAGTLILLSAIIIWFLSSYDWSMNYLGDNAISDSMLADIGNAVTWIFLPNGFGEKWQFSVATITGLMAKENLLATVAVLLDAATDADDIITADALSAFTNGGIAMSFLIFNLLCAPCFAAIGAMHRELGTWKRTSVAVLYQCVLAYGVSTVYYQFWLLCHGTVGAGLVLAAIFIAVPLYVILSKNPFGFLRDRFGKGVTG